MVNSLSPLSTVYLVNASAHLLLGRHVYVIRFLTSARLLCIPPSLWHIYSIVYLSYIFKFVSYFSFMQSSSHKITLYHHPGLPIKTSNCSHLYAYTFSPSYTQTQSNHLYSLLVIFIISFHAYSSQMFLYYLVKVGFYVSMEYSVD